MHLSLLSLFCVCVATAPADHVRHARITAEPCDTKVKTSYDLVITEVTPSSVADGKKFTKFTVVSTEAAKSSVTIKKDSNGWPVSFEMTGAGTDPDPITSMLFMMREPLWSPKPGAKEWEATIGNPFEPGKKLKVACHLTYPIHGQKIVQLEQKTALITLKPGMQMQFTTSSVYDSVGGKVKTVKVNVGVNATSKSGQLIFFEEKD